MLFPTWGSLPIVMTQPDETHANWTASVLEYMTGTEHSITSGLNEEDLGYNFNW